MMAFERLEPFGSLHEEFMAGQAPAMVFNMNRDPEKAGPIRAAHIFPALGRELGIADEGKPILLADVDAQSALIRALISRPEV